MKISPPLLSIGLGCLSLLLAPASAAEGLSEKAIKTYSAEALAKSQAASIEEYGSEWDKRCLKHGEFSMPFFYSVHGKKPRDGRALYISMHGGGSAPASVNDQQWENQKRLYTPKEGIYFVPRAPTDSWNMWHQGYMDPFIEKIIQLAIIKEGVNPNKVYIMGYSAGGDGTYQLAPRLADLWAAAAMSAGHPGDAAIENLYNLPFGLYMGGHDRPYRRNEIAQEWKVKLADLAKANRGAYIHDVRIFPQHGHWMQRDDAVSMKWMPKYTRNPIPKKVIWTQDDVLRPHFYWLAVPEGSAKVKDTIIASYKGNEITIERADAASFLICLNDDMLDLDKPVTVKRDGKVIYKGIVPRYKENILRDLADMRDRDQLFAAKLLVAGEQVTPYKAEAAQ